jgi:hypothetical protein
MFILLLHSFDHLISLEPLLIQPLVDGGLVGKAGLELPLLDGVIQFLLVDLGVQVLENTFDHFIVYFVAVLLMLFCGQTF